MSRSVHDLIGIRREADTIAAFYGESPYTRFLREHGRRPDPAEAAGMGLIMGARLKATDGKMYPPLTDIQRALRQEQRQRRRSDREAADRVAGSRAMIVDWPGFVRLANDNSEARRG